MRITSRTVLATLTAVSALAAACARPPRLAADLVVTGAEIWTGNQAQPAASAVAVIGDRIVEVGAADQIDRWRGPNTTVLDAGGRRLIPGFNDSYVRFVDGGTALDDVDLNDAATVEEFARRINERARAKPGEWLLGGQWDERRWTPPELPTRAAIDDITNSSPVFVVRYDGRMALANAAALGRAGVTEHTADPPDGAIVRGANGFPTGVLQGAAMDIVARVIPKVTPEQRLRVLKRALETAESLGVTSVQDAGATYEDIAAYADLANRGELTVRVYAVPAEGGWYDLAKVGVHRCVRIAVAADWRGARAGRSPPRSRRPAHAADGGRPRRAAAVRRCCRGSLGVDGDCTAPGHRSRQWRARSPIADRRITPDRGGHRAARIGERGRSRAAGSRQRRGRSAAGPGHPPLRRHRLAVRGLEPDAGD